MAMDLSFKRASLLWHPVNFSFLIIVEASSVFLETLMLLETSRSYSLDIVSVNDIQEGIVENTDKGGLGIKKC